MNRDIKIVGDSITFTNRGIGFFQAGISHEILALISDLQEENEKLREQIGNKEDQLDKLKECINNLYDDEYISYGNKEEMLKIIEGEDNE